MFSVAHYRNKIITGAPINANMPASNLFEGSDAVDPVTGQPLSDFSFTYPSYVNGPSGTQLGMEYTAKVAFTFLPWIFRHTGVDLNYSELDFEDFAASRDLMTGDFNPPQAQRSYFKNFTLWYDDSKFSARVSYQGAVRVLRLHLVLLERHQQLPDVVRRNARARRSVRPTIQAARTFERPRTSSI